MTEPKTLADVTDDDIDRWAEQWLDQTPPRPLSILAVVEEGLASEGYRATSGFRDAFLEIGRKVQDRANAIAHDRARAAER